MRALVLGSVVSLGACVGGGSGDPAWTDGPAGHVYTASGPIFDIDARDGTILRQLPPRSVGLMQASRDHAYFDSFDDAGQGHVYQLGTASDDITLLSPVSNSLLGVYGNELIGERNESAIVRIDLATGVDTQTMFPGVSCENGSLFEHSVYLVCMKVDVSGIAIGMLTYDLDASTFGPFVVVQPNAMALGQASTVNGTPSGAIFMLYEGQAQAGTRTAYKITGTTVSPGVAIAGTSDDLDEAAAVGNVVYTTLLPSDQVVPFDAVTMTAGAPIAIDHPRHMVSGGGNLWVGTHGHDGELAKIDAATCAIAYRTFDPVLSTEIDHLAYGGE